MEQALMNAKQALIDLNSTIANLNIPVAVDHSAEIQELADGINAAGQSLKDKFPTV